jgi:choline dehydrogenase-like flavoprotein
MSQVAPLSTLAALPSPLPNLPDVVVFTEAQWTVLFSILEVFLPSIAQDRPGSKRSNIEDALANLKKFFPDDASDNDATAYLAEDTSDPAFRDALIRKIKHYVPPSDAKALGFVLNTLNTTAGSLLLTGYTTPINKQGLITRTQIVSQWSVARLPLLRAIHKSLNGLARFTWITSSRSMLKVLDFPDVPKHIERNPTYDFKFHDLTSESVPTTISTDVVIVGSGCGAGVIASHLSRAGLKCLVLEKSYHFPSTHFPMSSGDAAEHLMESGGTLTSDDASTVIFAGSTFGGGGTINWSASLQPPHAVREEWASEGLTQFLSAEYQDCLDTICERMGVAKSTDSAALDRIEHNFANQTLLEGSRRLGLACKVVPQNTGHKKHFCGYCSTGCASTTKQGPANCWFPDAAAHGAEFIEGCWVEEVLFSAPNKKVASGVKAIWTSRDRTLTRTLIITAKRVIISSGTLQSPLVLLRSGLKNPNIGQNLHLHPSTAIWAIWPHRTNPWEGAILTSVTTALEDLDGKHHGVKIEVVCSTPCFGLLSLPYRAKYPVSADDEPLSSAIDFKLNAAKFAYATGFVPIARDRDTGSVYIDPSDPTRRRVRVKYTPSAFDRAHILEGIITGLRIFYTMGAIELESCIPGVNRWTRPSHVNPSTPSNPNADHEADEESFKYFIDDIKHTGLHPDANNVGSAHQMGTCRMSSSPRLGVVDGKGKVFGTEGLYVADASVFPSASGVNPMISTMGISEFIARGIVRELKLGK